MKVLKNDFKDSANYYLFVSIVIVRAQLNWNALFNSNSTQSGVPSLSLNLSKENDCKKFDLNIEPQKDIENSEKIFNFFNNQSQSNDFGTSFLSDIDFNSYLNSLFNENKNKPRTFENFSYYLRNYLKEELTENSFLNQVISYKSILDLNNQNYTSSFAAAYLENINSKCNKMINQLLVMINANEIFVQTFIHQITIFLDLLYKKKSAKLPNLSIKNFLYYDYNTYKKIYEEIRDFIGKFNKKYCKNKQDMISFDKIDSTKHNNKIIKKLLPCVKSKSDSKIADTFNNFEFLTNNLFDSAKFINNLLDIDIRQLFNNSPNIWMSYMIFTIATSFFVKYLFFNQEIQLLPNLTIQDLFYFYISSEDDIKTKQNLGFIISSIIGSHVSIICNENGKLDSNETMYILPSFRISKENIKIFELNYEREQSAFDNLINFKNMKIHQMQLVEDPKLCRTKFDFDSLSPGFEEENIMPEKNTKIKKIRFNV